MKYLGVSIMLALGASGSANAGGYVADAGANCALPGVTIPGYILCQSCPDGTVMRRSANGVPMVSRAGNGGYVLVCDAIIASAPQSGADDDDSRNLFAGRDDDPPAPAPAKPKPSKPKPSKPTPKPSEPPPSEPPPSNPVTPADPGPPDDGAPPDDVGPPPDDGGPGTPPPDLDGSK